MELRVSIMAPRSQNFLPIRDRESVNAAHPLASPRQSSPGLLCAAQVLWSTNGEYFSSRNECMPNVVFIWSTRTLTMCSILVQVGRPPPPHPPYTH